ncbi:MAG: alpha/beta fold hydrolase [Thermodesulfobacteriota bacterium]
MEEKLFIPSGEVRLEAVLVPGDPKRAAVVTHPHPLYGGSMHNNVVEAAVQGLSRAGWTSLRFNFRGVGRSTGRHGQGLAEQEDVAAAIDFLKKRGAETTTVAGYSFGAWVAALAWPRLAELLVRPLALIAPPAAFLSFEDIDPRAEIGLIVCGRQDDIAPPDLAEALGQRLDRPVRPIVLPGADHFFGGRETELAAILADYFREIV